MFSLFVESAMGALQEKLGSIRQRQDAEARALARAPGPQRVMPDATRESSRIQLLHNGAGRGSQEAGEEPGPSGLHAILILRKI